MKSTNDTSKIAAVALWLSKLKEDTNDTFFPLFFDTKRFLVLKGGGGSGKSIFAGRKLLERAATEKGHRILVCRKVGKTLRQSCFQQLSQQAKQLYSSQIQSIHASDMTITMKNGSQFIFSGLDDVEKLKSIYNITSIWIEEATEISESDLNQLNIRLRGQTKYYKQIILTLNPISATHWIKKRFFDKYDEDVTTHHSTYLDNKYLDEDQKKELEKFKETDEYYYTVYCLGQWGVTGRTVFNAKAVSERLAQNIKPVATGYFEFDEITGNYKFIDDENGFIKIYTQPEKNHPYVIGGDTAGDGSDSFVGQVIDNSTGKQVCVLKHTFDEDLYAVQMYCLGMYYNNALLAIEANFSTHAIRVLEKMNYTNMYVRVTEDTYTKKPKDRYGFSTNKLTRAAAIGELISAVRENIELVCDKDTLEEMLTFVRNENFRPEAEAGAHDDCIMALAIAHYARPQQSYVVKNDNVSTSKWTEDMWEDYNNATQAQKAMLLRLWGTPN